MKHPRAPLAARLLALVAAATMLPRGARADGIPVVGDPRLVQALAPRDGANPCVAEGAPPLDALQVPDRTDCNRYYVCCAGTPTHYACRVPSTPAPYVLYSDATQWNSYYSPVTGQCLHITGSWNVTDLDCGAAPVVPVSTKWAEQVCAAVRSMQAGPRASPGNGSGSGIDFDANGYQRVSMTKGLVTPQINERAPLEGGPEVVGAWELIRNPQGESITGVVAMHAALIPESDKTVAYPPGMTVGGRGQVAAVYDTATGTYQLLLGDGKRTLIASGYSAGENGVAVPSIEIFNAEENTLVTLDNVPALVRLGLGNLYPVMFSLPWSAPGALPAGSWVIVLFSGSIGEVMFVDPQNNINRINLLPPWPTPGSNSAFSAAGGAALLRLEPGSGYAAELAMFGGTRDAGACACDTPANDKAYRIKLDQAAVMDNTMAWEVEQMPSPRVEVDAVTLPNGKVILVNGAQWGSSNNGGPAGGSQQRGAEYHAWMYDPKAPAGARFSVLAASTIHRFYHSTALLLPSGDVLVMGSEQSDCVPACAAFNPVIHEFRAEVFKPPYAFSTARPVITSSPSAPVAMGDAYAVGHRGAADGAVLVAPGAVTHQNDANQRVIQLEVVTATAGRMTVRMPPAGSVVAPPGWYMLFVMNGDVPCTKAAWVQLVAACTPGATIRCERRAPAGARRVAAPRGL